MISKPSELDNDYKYGFVTDIASDRLPLGLNEEVVRLISSKKQEPAFMLDWRLAAYAKWQTMSEPHWAKINYPKLDYQQMSYYSAPITADVPKSLTEVDPELLNTYQKLGVPLHEYNRLAGVAVDAVFDSVSVTTTFKKRLEEVGVIFCPFSEAVQKYPELVSKYLGTVVPGDDNFFAALNAAVFSDGSFVYIPPKVRCPMELSTYFRINAAKTGQFERTLIIADRESYVSYLEGCSAPIRAENQLHAAVVELIALERAEIKYSTVQNWYPGSKDGKGGIYNFVTKRGECREDYAKIAWSQIETGSAITWKYPSTILRGNHSLSEFYSVSLTNNYQQADTGSKMIHLGKDTKSVIVAKGIAAGHSNNTYRGLVKVASNADSSKNYTQCDSLLVGSNCGSHTFPKIVSDNDTANLEHEASATSISEEQLFYCRQRGIKPELAVAMIVNGFCREVFEKMPMEFAVEAYKLISVNLEGAVNVED